jgi:hypothetical protein
MATKDSSGLDGRRCWAIQLLGGVVAASLFWSCGPSEDTASTAGNPKSDSTATSPSIAPATNKYSIGDTISFAAGGNSKPFQVSGWSDAEPQLSWTNGPVAVLALRIDPTSEPLTLHVKCGGFAKTPQGPPQPVEVFVNDQKIADWDALDLADHTAPIPPAISASGGLLTVTLKIPNAVSPGSLGLSKDPRLLGLSCVEVSLTRTQP